MGDLGEQLHCLVEDILLDWRDTAKCEKSAGIGMGGVR